LFLFLSFVVTVDFERAFYNSQGPYARPQHILLVGDVAGCGDHIKSRGKQHMKREGMREVRSAKGEKGEKREEERSEK